MSKPFCVKLKNRGLIHIEGQDRHAFLQGLITNNMDHLESGKLLYTCLLTPQGKFLHDFFVHDGGNFLLLDCEGGDRAEDLYTRLNKYRLRAKVQLSLEPHNDVYAVLPPSFTSPLEGGGWVGGAPDPRHPDMGTRSFEKPDMEERPFDQWDERRIRLGIPDGSRDMEIERSTLLECNLERFNAIDFNKGCYVGQELTARMHHRGLAKKHLYPVTLNLSFRRRPESSDADQKDPGFHRDDSLCFPAPFTDIESNGKLIGNMRSSCDDIGLALLKDDLAKDLNDDDPICLLG